ncbi:MAG: arylsulfatase [Bacteroidales bacterium]
MKNKRTTTFYLTGAMGFIAAAPTISARADSRDLSKRMPDIVLIVADDLGYGDLGCNGAARISTPSIDKIASEGMNFINAYASSSMSSPSRYCLMTGRYSWRTRLKSGVLMYYDTPLIEPGQTTLASMLKRNGYHTVHVGKWHLGFDWVLKDSTVRKGKKDFADFTKPAKGGPIERGFDYFYGMNGSNNMLPHAYMENDKVLGELTETEKAYDLYGFGVRTPEWEIEHVNEVLTHKATNMIDDHFEHHKEKPLFLYFATSAIHQPCLPTFTKGKSRAGMRGDMVQELDWTVGEIVKALKKNKAYDHTVLIFTSDNGPKPGDSYYWIKRYKEMEGYVDYHEDYYDQYLPEYSVDKGDAFARAGWLTYGHRASGDYLGFKADAWDGGFRVPFLVCWNKKVKAGTVSKNRICEGDVFATIAELVGDKLKPSEAEDSYSFLPNLTGKSSAQIRKSMVLSAAGTGAFVVIKEGWKYIEGAESGGSTFYQNGPFMQDFQLYNLKEDPFEKHNLYKSMPMKVAELKAEIGRVEKHLVREAD